MNVKQQKFVDYYIESGNAAQSYKRAGYSSKNRHTLDVAAGQALRNIEVSEAIVQRRNEIVEASAIRIESKRVLLWQIAQKASGRLKDDSDEVFQPDYKAAIAAINELNRMDGHHKDKNIRITDDRFTFDAEILPPESENAEFIQLDPPEKNDN